MTPPPLPKPRAILFDWDNTLVDTWPLIHAAMNMTLKHMGHEEWSIEKIRDEVKNSMRDSFPGLFGDRWKEAGDFYTQSYRSIHLTHLTALSGAEDAIAVIPRDRVFAAVVSNKQGQTLRKELEHLGWNKYFDVAIGAGDAARDKPHADPALLALKDSGIAPGPDVWFIGDTIADLGCAQNAGLTPILYGNFTTDGMMFEGYSFLAHARNQQELKALLAANCAV
jgi:phosphoglycolate phosphatase